jgi:hypothetical protein
VESRRGRRGRVLSVRGSCDGPAMFEGRKAVTGEELKMFGRLLDEVGGDQEEALLRIHVQVNLQG